MVNPFTLPALGGSLLAAVVLGIHLGESSVGLIDPVHFQGPAIHPRDRGAAIDPNRARPREPAFADHYGWEQGRAAYAAGCGDCEALAARQADAYSAVVPYFGAGDTVVAPPPIQPETEPKPEPRAEPRPRDAWAEREARVARYAHYAVDSREREEVRAVPAYAEDDVYLPPAEDPDAFKPRYEE